MEGENNRGKTPTWFGGGAFGPLKGGGEREGGGGSFSLIVIVERLKCIAPIMMLILIVPFLVCFA